MEIEFLKSARIMTSKHPSDRAVIQSVEKNHKHLMNVTKEMQLNGNLYHS